MLPSLCLPDGSPKNALNFFFDSSDRKNRSQNELSDNVRVKFLDLSSNAATRGLTVTESPRITVRKLPIFGFFMESNVKIGQQMAFKTEAG